MQMRMNCPKCLASWWHTPGSVIHAMDHARPDGRNCGKSLSYLAGEVVQTSTGLPPVKGSRLTMNKHPSCAECCRLVEDKGYRPCEGVCFYADPKCGCLETYPQLIQGKVSHGPGCPLRQDVVELPKCPKCGAEDAMEHRRHRFSTERGPNLPDADWDECVVCGYQTDPE